jgi:hypothetical protein
MFAKFICWLTGHIAVDHGPTFTIYEFSGVQQRCSRCGKDLGDRHF